MKTKYKLLYHQQGVDELSSSRHSHDNEIEIINVVSGSGNILLGTNFSSFKSNDVFIIDTNIIHCTSPVVPKEYVRNKLLFDKSLLLYISDIDLSCAYYFEDDGYVQDMFEKLHKMELDKSSSLLIYSEILTFLHYCLSHPKNNLNKATSISSKIISYINQHLTDDLSLDTLSNEIHISKYHLSRVFKKETGITLVSYIKNMRLALAKQRLVTSNDSIVSIAMDIGFNDSAAFNKFFSAQTGMSPSTYRKRYGNN